VAGVGPAIPTGSSTNYLGTAPLVKAGFGYRFNRLFQADFGLQAAFYAANNRNAELSDFGPVQGSDHEFMIPMGGRVIIPVPFKQLEFSVGGGAVYLHYSETVPSNGYYSSSCYSCTSRGGWGGYGLGNASYFLDENHTFRVGTTVQLISAATNGSAVGNVPALKTTDHWVNVIVEFGLSFSPPMNADWRR
jgi:hypothetical protein